MAASCVYSAVRSASKGLCHIWKLKSTDAVINRALASVCCSKPMCQVRHLQLSHTPVRTKTNAEQVKASPSQQPSGQESNKASSTKQEEEDEEDDGPEYIPKRKAKNPMMKIGYAWMIGLPTGIIGFILAKREVDKNRLKQLRIRQRMKKANEGEYESDRYKPASKLQ